VSVTTGSNATVYLCGVELKASSWRVVTTDIETYAPAPQPSDTAFRHLSLRRRAMSTRYLFLSIGGVLGTWNNTFSGKQEQEAGRVVQLNSILDAVPDLRVVLSGGWREYKKLSEWQEVFRAAGVSPKLNLVGIAPSTGRTRGGDVAAAMLLLGDVWAEDVVVLDDRPLDHPPLEHRLVMTDTKHGLTLRETLAVICMLRGYGE
jgi:hypothetical protein